MRVALMTSALLLTACLQPVEDLSDAGAVVDAGTSAVMPGEPPGRCDWDGGAALCAAVTHVVFDGVSCRSVCAPSRQAGEPGVFDSQLECAAFCVPPDGG